MMRMSNLTKGVLNAAGHLHRNAQPGDRTPHPVGGAKGGDVQRLGPHLPGTYPRASQGFGKPGACP